MTFSRSTEAVVDHVVRNRMTTHDVLCHLFDFTPSNLRQCTRRLVDCGWLRSHTLLGNRKYFAPGPRTVSKYQLPKSSSKPIPQQRLLQDYGALIYCSVAKVKRLLPRELEVQCEWMPKQLRDIQPFYIDRHSDVARLAMVCVETASSPYRIVQKHLAKLSKLAEIRAFRALLDADKFLMCVLTASPEARAKLEQLITNEEDYPSARAFDCLQLQPFCQSSSKGKRNASF